MSKMINLNLDWRFHLGEEVGADFMGHDDSAWRVVTLPHDWSVEHPFDKSNASGTEYLPGGTAWYRKHFTLPEEAAGKRVRITFGGVYKTAITPASSSGASATRSTIPMTPMSRLCLPRAGRRADHWHRKWQA